MKKLHSSVALAALAAIFMAAPAVAADMEAPPPPAYSWTGFHIGVGGGGNFAFVQEDANANVNANFDGDEEFMNGDHSADLGKAGFMGTVEAGFDYQLGSSVVAGILANYDFGKEKMKNRSATIQFDDGTTPTPEDNGEFETKWEIGDSWAIGGRLGFLAMDNALFYVTGGYTEAKVKSELDIFTTSGNDLSFHTSDSSWEDGWFVGGGIEALLTENISLKAEYRYNDYGSVKRNDSASDFLDATNSNAESHQRGDITVHSVRAVLSYRFNMF